MWSHHDDSKYVYHQQQYLKEFAIRFKENCSFLSSDDKAIPVGEPAHPISAGVCAHNASLGPSSGAKIGALDHDWKIAGVISSVYLFTEIFDTITSSFLVVPQMSH